MKKTAYVIGIDIGTQGTKAGLFDASGVCYAEAYEASALLHPAPGAVEQDPDSLYASVLHTVREVLEKSGAAPGEVLALSVAGQMAGIQGIDREWNAVTPYDNWLDTRCEPYIREMKAEAEEEIIRSTGRTGDLCPRSENFVVETAASGRVSKDIPVCTFKRLCCRKALRAERRSGLV